MIQLCPITPENQGEVRRLAVRADQERFVASVDKSLADAYVWQDAVFRAAYHDGKAIGFVLVFPFSENGTRVANIVRLMVDAAFQGRGLGREFLGATLDWVRSFSPAVDRVRVSTLPDNERALALYRSEGFEEHGLEDGEIALYRDLSRDASFVR